LDPSACRTEYQGKAQEPYIRNTLNGVLTNGINFSSQYGDQSC
jgi:hypothetical protein